MSRFIFVGVLIVTITYPAWAQDHPASPPDTHAIFGGGLLTGILGSTVVATIITQMVGRRRDREAARQKIMEFLVERRQALSKDTDLLQTIDFLNREASGNPGTPPFEAWQMRNLPAFLEPVGIYLLYNPSRFREAYQVFAKEVSLCAKSQRLWEGDDYRTSPYWTSFQQFVAETERQVPQKRL